MNLLDFKNAILDELNKGGSITAAQVELKLKAALAELELQRNWRYMHGISGFSIHANNQSVSVPTGLKAFEYVRFLKADGTYKNLDEISAEDVSKVETAEPSAYYRSGVTSIKLDNKPDLDYVGEWGKYSFTTWSSSDSFEPWPFIYFQPLVFYKALTLMAPFAREPQMLQMWSAIEAKELKIAVDADEELTFGNKPLRMQYK